MNGERNARGAPLVARRLGREPALNGLRGAAILLVVGYHYAFPIGLPGGSLGVDLFFVLSGFLITALLLAEWGTTGSISLRRFWARRALRLFPALGAFLLVAALLLPFAGPDRGAVARSIAASGLYVANLAVALKANLYFGHTWSLAEEEQYYLVWPVVILLCLKLRPRASTLVSLAAGGLVVCSLLHAALASRGGAIGDTWFLYYAPIRAEGLFAGCLLGVLYSLRLLPEAAAHGRAIRSLAWVALAVLAVAVFRTTTYSPVLDRGGFLAVAAAGAILVYAAMEAPPWPLRILRWRPLRYVGEISYALYLWHLPVLLVVLHAGLPQDVGLVPSFLLAVASYHLVERRFLRRKARYAPTPALAAVVVEPAEEPEPLARTA